MQSILNKFQNKHFLSLTANGTMAILAMITVALLLRYMSVTDVGYWFFFQTVFSLLDSCRTGFLQTALIKFYSGAPKKRAATVLGSMWYLSLVITGTIVLIDLLALAGLQFIHNSGISIVVKWFSITFLCTLPLSIASWIIQAEQRFYRLLILRFINQGLFVLMILIMIFLKEINLNTVLVINVLCAATTSLFCLVKGWTEIKTLSKRSTDCILELFHFGKYSMGTTIIANLLRSSDTLIILFLLGSGGPAAVAMYVMAMRLMEIIEIPLRSFLATGMPAMSAAFNENKKEKVAKIMQQYAGVLTVALLPVCITAIIFADLAIDLLGGGKYSGTYAVSVYRISMSFALFLPIDRFLGITLDIIHKPRINFYKVIVMLTANVVFDFLGIYIFGNINGVAIASFFTFLSGIIFGYYWLRKYLDFTLYGILETGFKETINFLQKTFFKISALPVQQ